MRLPWPYRPAKGPDPALVRFLLWDMLGLRPLIAQPDPAAMTIQPIRSILIANRSEIAIRVMRAASEMRIRTVAIYSQQDLEA